MTSDFDIWRAATLVSRALLISGAIVIWGTSMAADSPGGDCSGEVRGLPFLPSDDNDQAQQTYRHKISYYCGAHLIKGQNCNNNSMLINEPVLSNLSIKPKLLWHIYGWKSKADLGLCSCLIDE
jgi:hypothetical protein